jgi:lipoprotein-anchoring transpeptidase ErfK/SrfK
VFKQVEPQSGSRLHVQDPYSDADAWLDAASVGPIDAPSQLGTPGRWWGVSAVDGANQRAQPTTASGSIGTLASGLPLVVSSWVAGEEVVPDNPTWAALNDSTFVYSSVLRPVALPSAPPPPESTSSYTGRWIDLNLTQQVVVAYQGQNPVRLARTSTGRPGWETGAGRYTIQRRVENETMDSSSLIGLDAQRASYKVDNVRWTQYFSADGKALHENYWKPRDEFGIPSSHGCAGLVAEDALYFWNWADIGVPVIAHY